MSELKGIANGADVKEEEIFLLNTGYPEGSDGCTTFAAYGDKTKDGNNIFPQNIDNNIDMRSVEKGIILR